MTYARRQINLIERLAKLTPDDGRELQALISEAQILVREGNYDDEDDGEEDEVPRSLGKLTILKDWDMDISRWD
jgi:hypothetical protein